MSSTTNPITSSKITFNDLCLDNIYKSNDPLKDIVHILSESFKNQYLIITSKNSKIIQHTEHQLLKYTTHSNDVIKNIDKYINISLLNRFLQHVKLSKIDIESHFDPWYYAYATNNIINHNYKLKDIKPFDENNIFHIYLYIFYSNNIEQVQSLYPLFLETLQIYYNLNTNEILSKLMTGYSYLINSLVEMEHHGELLNEYYKYILLPYLQLLSDANINVYNNYTIVYLMHKIRNSSSSGDNLINNLIDISKSEKSVNQNN